MNEERASPTGRLVSVDSFTSLDQLISPYDLQLVCEEESGGAAGQRGFDERMSVSTLSASNLALSESRRPPPRVALASFWQRLVRKESKLWSRARRELAASFRRRGRARRPVPPCSRPPASLARNVSRLDLYLRGQQSVDCRADVGRSARDERLQPRGRRRARRASRRPATTTSRWVRVMQAVQDRA